MPITIKGIYENGKIELLEKPPRIFKGVVYIQFVKFPLAAGKNRKAAKSPKFDLKKFKKTASKTFGAVPNLPSGIEYENDMRKKSDWERKYGWDI